MITPSGLELIEEEFDLSLLNNNDKYILAALFKTFAGVLNDERGINLLHRLTLIDTGEIIKSLEDLARYNLTQISSRKDVIDNHVATADFIEPGPTAWKYPNILRITSEYILHDPYPTTGPESLKIPKEFHYLFWNDDADRLNINDHGYYIALHLLEHGGWTQACWVLDHIPEPELAKILQSKRIDPRIQSLVRGRLIYGK